MAKAHLQVLVLAAGAGSRFGGGKLLARWRGRPMIEAALAAAYAAPSVGVTLVTGADPMVEQTARAFAGMRPLAVVRAEGWSQGLSASIKTGVASLPEGCTGVLVFLGDMPRIPHAVLPPLAEALAGGAPAAVPVFGGQMGHPAALSAGLFSEVLKLEGDRGARRLLERLGSSLVRIAAPDDGVLFDVDSQSDLDQS
jgi:molybdenum cofactor cytidylyltransferase